MSGLLFVADMSEAGRVCFQFYCFQPPPSQNKVKYSNNKYYDKNVLLKKIETRTKLKHKEKIELKCAI